MRPCPRCELGVDTDGDGDCPICAHLYIDQVAQLREAEQLRLDRLIYGNSYRLNGVRIHPKNVILKDDGTYEILEERTMKLKPTGSKVVVKRDEAPTMTAGGLHLPAEAQEKNRPARGTILAAGPDTDLEPDTQILFGRFSGTEVEVDGEKYLILREEDVIATIEPK